MKGTFRLCLTSHCRGVTETSHLALPTHSLQAVQVWSKSVGNEGDFTREAETVIRPPLSLHCSGDDQNVTPGTPYPCAISSASLAEVGL